MGCVAAAVAACPQAPLESLKARGVLALLGIPFVSGCCVLVSCPAYVSCLCVVLLCSGFKFWSARKHAPLACILQACSAMFIKFLKFNTVWVAYACAVTLAALNAFYCIEALESAAWQC